MSATDSRQLIEKALASVETRVQQQIAEAAARRERDRQQRAQLAAARQAGIGKRHAARLRHQANRGDTPTVADPRGAADHAAIGQQPTTIAQTDTVARSPKDPTPAASDRWEAGRVQARAEGSTRKASRQREASPRRSTNEGARS